MTVNPEMIRGLDRAGWELRDTFDSLGRKITWYRSRIPSCANSLLLWLQGSGCQPLFRLRSDGQVTGGYQNLLRSVSTSASIRVLAVEKPGVRPFEVPDREKGTAIMATAEFQREHTLPRWVAAINSVMDAAICEDHPSKIGMIGHSEGALTAAVIAARDARVSHLGLLGCGGMTGFAERFFHELSRGSRKELPGVDTSVDESSRHNVEELTLEIMSQRESTERLAWGHSFARWSTFGTLRVGHELRSTTCQIFTAHGENDDQVPLASFCALIGDLWAFGKKPKIVVVAGGDHGFRNLAMPNHAGMSYVLEQFVEWMLRS